MSFTWRVTSTEQNQILNESSSIIHLLHPTDKSIFSLTLFFFFCNLCFFPIAQARLLPTFLSSSFNTCLPNTKPLMEEATRPYVGWKLNAKAHSNGLFTSSSHCSIHKSSPAGAKPVSPLP